MLQLQLNAIEAEIATAKGHRKHYRDKKNDVLKKISNMEAELKAFSEDAEVCGVFEEEVEKCDFRACFPLGEFVRANTQEVNVTGW